MHNRNFDYSDIIRRRQEINNANSFYNLQKNNRRLVFNPQVGNFNYSNLINYPDGVQTEYQKAFQGYLVEPSGILNLVATGSDPVPVPPPAIEGSMFFDSTFGDTGSHVSYPNSSSLSIGSQSFTIEWYQYWEEGASFPRVFSIGSYESENIDIAVSYEGTFYLWINGTPNDVGPEPPKNTWVHIAIVGISGELIKVYQNGVEIGEVSGSYSFTDDTTPLMIGNETIANTFAPFTGKITNFRWVVGTAVYTADFTPPTIPLSDISGTQLLLLVSSETDVVKDSSSSNRTPTNEGVVYSPDLPPMPFVSVPSAPTITTIGPSNNKLIVNFTPGFNGGSAITSYQYSTDDGDTFIELSGNTISPIEITSSSSDGSSLVNGTEYTVRLKARNSIGLSSASSPVSGTPATTPDAPSITGITAGNQQLSVAFSAPVSDGGSAITNYEYSTDNGSNWTTRSPTSTVSPIIISPLTNGTTYQVKIRAVNAINFGTASTAASGIPATTPGAPNITGITAGNQQLSVAFSAPVSDGGSAITNYEYSTDNGSNWTSRSPTSTVSPIIISPLTNGTTYQVKIRAVNAINFGTASTAVPGTPVAPGWKAFGTPGTGVSGIGQFVKTQLIVGSDLYIAGSFNNVNGVAVNYIAKWNGSSWSSLGAGIFDQTIFSLTSDGLGNIYAGGNFTDVNGTGVNYIAKYDGTSWTPITNTFNNNVQSLLFINNKLYAAGRFTGGIQSWDGTSWSSLGTGLNDSAYSIASDSLGNIYVGGNFNSAGGVANTNKLAKWNGSSWSSVTTQTINDGVLSVALDSSSNIYIGGAFTQIGASTFNYIAKWNGSSWSALGTGFNNVVYTISISGTDIYAGGTFTNYNRIVKWNGSSWSNVGGGAGGIVESIINTNDKLYVGGQFNILTNTDESQIVTNGIAEYSPLV